MDNPIMIDLFSRCPAQSLRLTARVLALCAVMSSTAVRADDPGHHDHHAHHLMPPPSAAVVRSEQKVVLPPVGQRSSEGVNKSFAEFVGEGRPVVVNFIYTTCTAICPPMTRVFAEVQERLGAERESVRLISVSIDPEQDTPRRLKAYGAQYGAVAPWVFLTGSEAASTSIQQAFNVFRPDKMGHTPVTFIRRQPGESWIRLDGIASAERILAEVHGVAGGRR